MYPEILQRSGACHETKQQNNGEINVPTLVKYSPPNPFQHGDSFQRVEISPIVFRDLLRRKRGWVPR